MAQFEFNPINDCLEICGRGMHNASMSDPIKITKGDDYTCKCGAVYEVKWTHTPIPDTDYADCEHCGVRIKSWNNSTTWPSYELKSLPK